MKIVPIMLKYDYGIAARGDSLEKIGFLPALQDNAEEVVPFWLEDNGLFGDKVLLQNKIIDFVNNENPEIVFFVLMRDEVKAQTLEKLSENFITINWFCDDHWRFEDFTRYVAPKLRYSITTDKYSLPKYKEIGYKNVILSQWASFDYVKDIDFQNMNYEFDITFIGGKNPTREWIINYLTEKGFKISCFGSGWQNGRASYDRMKDIFLKSKINLNLSNSTSMDIRFINYSTENYQNYLNSTKRVEQVKARNFEIPCFGGFQLTNYALELEDYFYIGKDLAIYTNLEELELQLKYYLENDEKRRDILMSGYKKAEKYTYKEKLKWVIEKVKAEQNL
jgi:spore maturation protein CgeB